MKYEVQGHEPSLLPEGRWELVWADEFDGNELDHSGSHFLYAPFELCHHFCANAAFLILVCNNDFHEIVSRKIVKGFESPHCESNGIPAILCNHAV